MPFNLITKVGTKEGNFPSGSIKVADEEAIFLMSFPLIKQAADDSVFICNSNSIRTKRDRGKGRGLVERHASASKEHSSILASHKYAKQTPVSKL